MNPRASTDDVRLEPNLAQVPAFFLYGEPLQAPNERLIHIETIAARSRVHDWRIRPHRHRDLHQVLLIKRGRIQARLDGRTLPLRAPAAIIVPPGAVHSFQFQPGAVGVVVSFAPGLARELAAPSRGLIEFLERPGAAHLERQALDATDLWALGQMLMREFERSAPGRHAALRGLLGAFLGNLLRLLDDAALTRGTGRRSAHELIARFRALIEVGFRTPRSVADYAAELATSEATLRRACLTAAGQSPLELLLLRRLLEGERQLRYTSMSIAQIAYYLGFDDPAYFARFFKRRMGVSPRTFRASDGAELEK